MPMPDLRLDTHMFRDLCTQCLKLLKNMFNKIKSHIHQNKVEKQIKNSK